jgi:hypothetical protein
VVIQLDMIAAVRDMFAKEKWIESTRWLRAESGGMKSMGDWVAS